MLLIAPLLIFLSRVDVVPPSEPVQQTLWDIVQQAVSFLVALATLSALCYPVGKWLWRRYKARRDAERAAREQARAEEIRSLVAAELAPMQKQMGDVHRTTHINGGISDNPTVLDKLANLSKQLDQCIAIVGAVSSNQAALTTRMDESERLGREYVDLARGVLADAGINLPEYRG